MTDDQVTPTAIVLHENLDGAFLSDVGEKRSENQDRFGKVENKNFKIFVVADGMGGANGGSTASQMAIDCLSERFAQIENIQPENVYVTLTEANDLIFKKSIENKHLAGMGTTCVMLAFTAQEVYITNVGDSRAYLVRNGEIKKLTEDHTLVNELLKAGIITEDQAENHPVSHMLTRCLGPAAKVEIDCSLQKPGALAGDVYLICSDGLYNLVFEDEIAQIISEYAPSEACKKLVDLANERGGNDNITVGVVKVIQSPHQTDTQHTHYDIVPISFKNIPGYVEEESFERILLRHSASVDRYGLDLSGQMAERDRRSFWGNIFLGIMAAAVVGLAYYLVLSEPTQLQRAGTTVVLEEDIPVVTAVEPVVQETPVPISYYDKYLVALGSNETYAAIMHEGVEIENKLITEENKLSAMNAELIGLNKQLSIWVNQKKKLEDNGAMYLSDELSLISKDVKTKQQAFQEASWEYLQNLNLAQLNPQDQELAQIVKSQLELRKTTMKELEIEVYSLIQEKVNSLNRKITELMSKIVSQTDFVAQLHSELELYNQIKGLSFQTERELIETVIRAKIAQQLAVDTASEQIQP